MLITKGNNNLNFQKEGFCYFYDQFATSLTPQENEVSDTEMFKRSIAQNHREVSIITGEKFSSLTSLIKVKIAMDYS